MGSLILRIRSGGLRVVVRLVLDQVRSSLGVFFRFVATRRHAATLSFHRVIVQSLSNVILFGL